MKIICDVCGRNSASAEICTNCGAAIVSEVEIPDQSTSDRWGWGVFKFDMSDLSKKEEAINFLRAKWASLEEFTVLRLLTSQLSRFQPDVSEIKVIIREDFFSTIWRDASNKFEGLSVKFEPVYSFHTAEEVNQLLSEESSSVSKPHVPTRSPSK